MSNNSNLESNYYQPIILVIDDFNNPHKFIEEQLGIKSNTYITDVITATTMQSISIEQIRAIIEESARKIISKKIRIIVLNDADDIKDVGQNSLLKILEEPPVNTLFILSVHNINKIINTILSRCKVIKIHRNIENTNIFDESILIKMITADKKDKSIVLQWKGLELNLKKIELQYFATRIESNIDITKISKLFLFDLWINK